MKTIRSGAVKDFPKLEIVDLAGLVRFVEALLDAGVEAKSPYQFADTR